MTDAEWPAPEPATPREPERRTTPLPRVEDLPVAEQGYDREKVREAFDAFYRHAAQLDATLSTLEAVEAFQRTSAELRAELRNIRGSGWTVQSWQGGTGYPGGGGSRGGLSEWTLPPSFVRLSGEFAFLILVGVVVGVAGWSALTIVLVMGLALAVVLLIESVAARERAIPRAVAPAAAPDLDRDEPAELSVGEPKVAPEEGPEALTMLDEAVAEVEPEPEPEPEDLEPEPAAVEVELEVVELPLDEPEEPVEPAAELEPEPEPDDLEPEQRLDPWEQEAQLPYLPEAEEVYEAEEQLVEPPRRSWFRHRAGEDSSEPDEPVAVAPEPEPEPEDQGPLPVDLLTDQAAAALDRSRARRRTPRRARRR